MIGSESLIRVTFLWHLDVPGSHVPFPLEQTRSSWKIATVSTEFIK